MDSVYRIKIKEMPEDMRPREKMLSIGPEALTTAELLAVILRTGNNSMSAIDLATMLLVKSEGLMGLIEKTPQDLCRIKGIGPAKVAQLKAAVELGRRLACEVSTPKGVVSSPADVYNLLKERMRYYDREYFTAVLLNTKHHIIGVEIISIGSLNASLVHPRELFKSCIKRSAAALIVAHNHPSGDPTPSAEDREITRRLAEVGKIVGIQVLDHIIIGEKDFVSLKEQGVI